MENKPKETVLIVDDEPRLLDYLVDTLADSGFHVQGVTSGSAALDALRREEFNTVLIDYELGDMTGLALAKELRRIQEGVSVILMTAYASLDMAVKAIQADVYDYLIKPIDGNKLKRSINNALERYRLKTENKKLLENLKKTNAELSLVSERKSRFMSIVSHDLRSPLSSIRGYAQLMLIQENLSKEQTNKFFNIIINQTDYLNGLIKDLSDVASIDAGQLRVEKEPRDILEIISTVKARMDPLAALRGITLNTRVNGTDTPPVSVDRRRIEQCLTNLVSNATKHTPKGGSVTLSVTKRPTDLFFDVVDTGEGIPAEALPYIFDEFFQVMSHESRREGLGLGLTITKEIITAHQGEIGAESPGPGKGTRVWFTLPTGERSL